MPPFVKICGMANAPDVEAVAALEPDALGFVFWPKSPRAVQPAEVGRWTRDLPKALLKVGVFVDAEPDTVRRSMDEAGLDVAQLHGDEDPAYCQALGRPCWKALRAEAVSLDYPVEALLIDSGTREQPGGTGQTADWTRARELVGRSTLPVLLAGGLHADNVAAALAAVGPWGVDVSSGVEAEPGRKDLAAVAAFIAHARG